MAYINIILLLTLSRMDPVDPLIIKLHFYTILNKQLKDIIISTGIINSFNLIYIYEYIN